MRTITTIGLDIAKSVFQVHGVPTNIDGHCRRATKKVIVDDLQALCAKPERAALSSCRRN